MLRTIALISVCVLVLQTSCKKDEPLPNDPLQITIMGDSRVEGGPQEEFKSFRYYLWKKLLERDIEFDFLGTRKDSQNYEAHLGKEFDVDHEGKLGDRSDQLLSRIVDLINNHPSQVGNVAIISVGANDLYQAVSANTATDNIKQIVDELQQHNNSITIFIEQIEDGTTSFNTLDVINQEELALLNNNIAGIAIENTTNASKVIAVNMVSLLNDADYADNLHYNVSGAEKIAAQYFNAMNGVLF